MSKIKFEIKKPGPIAIKVVNIIGLPYYALLNFYEVQGKYEVFVSEENLIPFEKYYYRIYDMEGMEDTPIESLNGDANLIDSGNLQFGNNNFNELLFNEPLNKTNMLSDIFNRLEKKLH